MATRVLFMSSGLSLLFALVTSCGSDDAAPSAGPQGGSANDASAGTAGRGSGGSAGSGGGVAGSGGSGASGGGVAGSSGSDGSSGSGGAAGTSGATADAAAGTAGVSGSGGTSGSAGSAGSGNTSGTGGTGGTAGSGDGGEDIVVINGGSWPDSLTGACATDSGSAACPRVGEEYYGQDGTYRVSVPTYTATADTLVDSVTGLMWQKSPPTSPRGQGSAASYCSSLSLEGYDDWRLPSRLEYVSVLDMGRKAPAFPPGFVVAGAHWTSSPTAAGAGNVFIVNDSYGLWTVTQSGNTCLVRCVRGAALSGTLQVGADTVIDSMTGLEWQRSALDSSDVTWTAALAHCEGLTHASRTDWRLPSIKELATLVDESDATAPVIDEASFGPSSAGFYWSSTPAFTATSDGHAVALQTNFGVSTQLRMSAAAAVRCVRQAR